MVYEIKVDKVNDLNSEIKFRSYEEKDLHNTRKKLADSKYEKIIKEKFYQEAKKNLTDLTKFPTNLNDELINKEARQLILVDGSQTIPKSNGKISSSFISAASMPGLMRIKGFKPLHKSRSVSNVDNYKNSKAIELSRLDLELSVLSESCHSFPHIINGIDGSLKIIPKKISQMHQYEMMQKTESIFEMNSLDNLENLMNLIESGKVIGITKETSCKCIERFVEPYLKGVNLLKHNELANYFLRPGMLLQDNQQINFHMPSYLESLPKEYYSKLERFFSISSQIRTYSYMPLMGNGTYVRFEVFPTDFKNLLQIVMNLDFDKQGEVIEPWCQLKADNEAVKHASCEETRWDVKKYLNEDYEDKKYDITAPTRLVPRKNKQNG